MSYYGIHFWQRSPFVRLLIPLMMGILLQWYMQVPAGYWWMILFAGAVIVLSFFLIPLLHRYRLGFINGVGVALLFCSLGALLAWQKDIRHDAQWLGNNYHEKDVLLVSLIEPPVEKTKSIKANARVEYIISGNQRIAVKGTIILYFKKDSALQLGYGSQLIFSKALQTIKNAGNPGGFDYKRYALFQGITHQVYLNPGEFEILPGTQQQWLSSFIIQTRKAVLNILRKNIYSEKELGLAEALLIGYKDDLDQTLVQSYTNTGVVHVIAISGLHLGLIYWLLLRLFKPLQRNKKLKWLRPVLIITGLWLFSLLAGAQPSVLRSALMFTCLVIGEGYTKRSSIINTLAFSAFVLLCINPYWLWDVGFQLSYAAVLSIVLFMQPIYNWFYFKNKAVDFLWKLNAVTLAAQILTIPVSIYHFHQFPNYFLLTNFMAVPVSSAIVLGEILLCVIAFIPALAALVGKLLHIMIWLMNSYIERIESIPGSLWDGLQISMVQTILLVIAIAGISYWLMEKSVSGLKAGLLALLCFAVVRSYSFYKTGQQQKIIVYNVPQKPAIDLINGHDYLFVGDSSLLEDDFARNFHLKPSRILYRLQAATPSDIHRAGCYINCNGKRVLLINDAITYQPALSAIPVDLAVISGNPRLYIKDISRSFHIRQLVFDGSAVAWKVNYWKKDCDSLGIPWHDVNTMGAYIQDF